MPDPVRPRANLLAMLLLALALLFTLSSAAKAQVQTLPAMKTGQLSVSGLSSGGYMAVQFEVAYSGLVKGAGIIAGGPYYCAHGNLNTATNVCSCTSSPYLCQVRPGGTGVDELIAVTEQYAARGAVDPTAGLAGHRVWMFSGSADTLVPQPVMADLYSYYRHYIDAAQIVFKKDLAAQHAMPTDSYGNDCGTLGSPYISNCGYDAAGTLLGWIYGSLNPRNTGSPAGRFIEFDQSEFLADPGAHGMAASGFLYLPPGCAEGGSGCRLHVVFHGCLQDPGHIGDQFLRHAGYNGWADSNRIVLLYPQAAPIYPLSNPNACWDWFNYDDSRYAQKNGRQMLAVRQMVERLSGGAVPPPPGPQCYTASNVDHVRAGRAHDSFFIARANGSNQNMGLDNIFIVTTLRRTGPNHYVVGSCP